MDVKRIRNAALRNARCSIINHWTHNPLVIHPRLLYHPSFPKVVKFHNVYYRTYIDATIIQDAAEVKEGEEETSESQMHMAKNKHF